MKRSALKRGKAIRRVSDRMITVKDLDQLWSRTVRARDDFRCQGGSRVPGVACLGVLGAHHVFPKEDYPHLRHDVGNGVTLCIAHHRWVHDVDPWNARSPKVRLLGPFRVE